MSTGADGLMKLWTIRTNECEATFDAHTDKVRTLALSSSGEQLVTGGADSLVNIWRDKTQEKEEEDMKQVEERMLKEQDLMTSIYSKDYDAAVELAFELGHSYRLWNVLSEVMETDNPVAVTARSWRQLKLMLRLVLQRPNASTSWLESGTTNG
eukprot:FR739442.1.p1 GENE.FR739442.1~~FR739442.1.p1  ORF type:complete len:154 (+),score=32.76 FR739442.1:2-463(+)